MNFYIHNIMFSLHYVHSILNELSSINQISKMVFKIQTFLKVSNILNEKISTLIKQGIY